MTAEIIKDASDADAESLGKAIRAFLPADRTSVGSFPLNYPPYGTIGTVNYQVDWDQETADLQAFFDGNQVCQVMVSGQASAPFSFTVSKGPVTANVSGAAAMDWTSQTLTLDGEAKLKMGPIHMGTKDFDFTNSTWS